MTRIRVLGCSGGIGDHRHTTSFMVDNDVLIDAGSGVLRLSRAEMVQIDHVFITHTHLDHILALPLLVDSVGEERRTPVTVHAMPAVIERLKAHLFNNVLWPDFSQIPTAEAPFMCFSPVSLGVPVVLGERRITALPARHTVPACAWQVSGLRATWTYSGDTAGHPDFWQTVADYGPDDSVIVETSFPNAQADIAALSAHYHPTALAHDWKAAASRAALWITHLKPGAEDVLAQELTLALGHPVQILTADQEFEV